MQGKSLSTVETSPAPFFTLNPHHGRRCRVPGGNPSFFPSLPPFPLPPPPPPPPLPLPPAAAPPPSPSPSPRLLYALTYADDAPIKASCNSSGGIWKDRRRWTLEGAEAEGKSTGWEGRGPERALTARGVPALPPPPAPFPVPFPPPCFEAEVGARLAPLLVVGL
jgi:hypothetical protein